MRINAWIIVGALIAGAPAGAVAQDQLSLDDAVEGALGRSLTPGAIVAVVLRDSVAFMKTYGHTTPDSAALLPAEAQFHAGGLTEVVNALAALQLEAAGRLDLDAAIGTLVPELPSRFRGITTRQLLSHTAGLAATEAVPGRGGADDLAAAARSLTPLDRLAAPGALYSHSTIGQALTGLIIARAGRKAYPAVIREHVLTPLGMSATSFLPATGGTLTPGWQRSMSPDRPIEEARVPELSAAMVPVEGLVTTVPDLTRLAAALLSDGVVNGEQRLPAGMVAQLLRAQAAIPGGTTSAALGVRIGAFNGHRAITISATGSGHSVIFMLIPAARLGLVVMANAPGSVLGLVPNLVLSRILPDAAAAPATPAPADSTALAAIAAAPGRYLNGSELLEVLVRDGRPVLRSGDLTLDLQPLPGGMLGAMMHGREMMRLRFITDDDGRPYLWIGQRALGREQPRR